MNANKLPLALFYGTFAIILFSTIAIFSFPAFALESEENDRLTEILEQCQSLEREEKLAACDRALELDANSYIGWFERGRALLSLGRSEDSTIAFDEAKEALERAQQQFFYNVMNNLEMPYRRRAYEIYTNFAKQRIDIGANQCYSQILFQFQQIQSLLQDNARIQQIDAAIASGQITGDRLEQFQTIRQQIETLQQNPERLDAQRSEAFSACQERAAELRQRVDENLRNTLESLERNNPQEP